MTFFVDKPPSQSKLRDGAAKGPAPTWTWPLKKGQRCPRCHATNNRGRCALCNPRETKP